MSKYVKHHPHIQHSNSSLTTRGLIACGRNNFEVRHIQEAPDCWRDLNTAVSPEVYRIHTKACK